MIYKPQILPPLHIKDKKKAIVYNISLLCP